MLSVVSVVGYCTKAPDAPRAAGSRGFLPPGIRKPRRPQLHCMTDASASKKRRVTTEAAQPELKATSSFAVPGLTLQDFQIKAPLDHFSESESSPQIDIFFRVVEGTNKLHCKQPFLLYLQGAKSRSTAVLPPVQLCPGSTS